MGLPAEIRRENKEYERSHPRPPRPHYYTAEELAPIKPPDTSLIDRFQTRWTIEEKEVTLLISPDNSHGKVNGFPRLYGIGVNGKHFGWVILRESKWQWFSNEQPESIAEQIGEIIITAHYQ